MPVVDDAHRLTGVITENHFLRLLGVSPITGEGLRRMFGALIPQRNRHADFQEPVAGHM